MVATVENKFEGMALDKANDHGDESRIEREINATRKDHANHERVVSASHQDEVRELVGQAAADHQGCGAEGHLNEARAPGTKPERLNERGSQTDDGHVWEWGGRHGEKKEKKFGGYGAFYPSNPHLGGGAKGG